MHEELAILSEFFNVKSWDKENFEYQKPLPLDGHQCELVEFEGYENIYILRGFHRDIQIAVFKQKLFVHTDIEKSRLQELCDKIRTRSTANQLGAV